MLSGILGGPSLLDLESLNRSGLLREGEKLISLFLHSKDEKKALANTEASTVDVDELWARLNSAPKSNGNTKPPDTAAEIARASKDVDKPTDGFSPATTAPEMDPKPAIPTSSSHSEPMITIKRTYVFAGQTTTEEKLVPASSAEARLYLQSQEASQQPQQQLSSSPNGRPPLRRPKKRASMFDPNPNRVPGAAAASNKGPKLNTIEKSKMDWAGYVDQEGIKEELDKAEKGKDGYLGKMDFLGRVGAKREDVIKKK